MSRHGATAGHSGPRDGITVPEWADGSESFSYMICDLLCFVKSGQGERATADSRSGERLFGSLRWTVDMEYHEAVNRLEQLRQLRPKLGTETTAALLDHHGRPHEQLTAVQIAGSNGKGSTARVLDSICQETGANVGLYTSPDLNGLRERIQVDGQKIPKHEVARFVEATWPFVLERAAEEDAPTFFEVVTAMALWYFERADVDIAVLEVGIGGRYDATSVVDPVASAVTSVSLEHTDILGETVTEIARDKAHVAPGEGQLVTGATGEALAAIREMTDVVTVAGASELDGDSRPERDADVRATEREMLSQTEAAITIAGDDWQVETETPLLGSHQTANAGIAAVLARQVVGATAAEITAGVRTVTWPGRFELLDRAPAVVLDGAHNPAACEQLATLVERFSYDGVRLVFGAMRDKDHAEMCAALPAAEHVYLARPDVSRALDTEVLAEIFGRETTATVEQVDSVRGAVERALSDATQSELVLVTGSLYTVAEARDRWTRSPVERQPSARADAESILTGADLPREACADGADRLVHRTVQLHAHRTEAERVKEEMLSLGGYCGVSAVEATEHVQVVLAGTLKQYRTLVSRLHDAGEGTAHLARQLQTQLQFDHEGAKQSESGYPWEEGTAIMGILNVTPDSFYDGGEHFDSEAAVAHAREMVAAGADIVDIGGESTRPGADPVDAETERERVVPVVETLATEDVTLSIDTRKPGVAAAALDAGADIVNDVTGLTDPRMRRLVADHDVPAVVMHSLSAPVDPDRSHEYDDVVDDVLSALTERLLLAERTGIDRSQLLVDPGLGFGKRAAESYELLDRLAEFETLGAPVLVGHSRKSMFAGVSDGDRLPATLAATALAVDRGADIVRVHDVPENVAAAATAARTAGRETN